MVTFTNQQGYSRNDGPTQFAGLSPTSPQFGNRAITTSAEGTIFQYDVITVYGMGSSVSNSLQTTRIMPGWGLVVVLNLLTAQAMTLRIYVNSGVTATFTQISSSPIAIALNAAWQTITIPMQAAAHIRGTLQAGTNATVEYHVRLLEEA